MRVGRVDFRPSVFMTFVTVVLVAVLITLGLWQLGRAEEKRALQEQFEARTREQPVQLEVPGINVEDLEYRRVTVSGTYDRDHQFLLDNRTDKGIVGYHVLTPLVIDEGNVGVVINRGWVPLGEHRGVMPDLPTPECVSLIVGVVNLPPSETFLLGSAGYEASSWPRVVQAVELDEMEKQLGYRLLPFIVLLSPQHSHGFSRSWKPYYGLGPERHQGYAVQWFALAVTLLVIYVVVNARRSPRTSL